jgi:hypothetical protein
VIVLFLLACGGHDETDTAGDTDTGEILDVTSVAEADATVIGDRGASGASLTVADVSGDGVEDLVVGGITGNRACVVAGPLAGETSLESATCIAGEVSGDYAGWNVAPAGDANGDGLGDLLVGSPGHDGIGSDAGRAYVVLGPVAASDLTTAWATFDGEASLDGAGTGITSLGDMDGDGDVDLLIGAPANDAGGPGAGRAYLIRGPISPGVTPLASAAGRIQGASSARHAGGEGGDAVGWSVAGLGDVDGDGLGDALISAGGNDDEAVDAGLVALWFGPIPAGNLGLGAADARIFGAHEGAFLGEPVSGAEDLDGDGLRDLLIGTSSATDGRVYVVVDPPSGDAAIADAAAVTLVAAGDDGLGGALTSGDLDGDGIADLALGARYASLGSDRSGAVYVVPGPLGSGTVDAREAASRRIAGEIGSIAGNAVGAGALGGDAIADLAVGAPLAADGGGAVHVFFGSEP